MCISRCKLHTTLVTCSIDVIAIITEKLPVSCRFVQGSLHDGHVASNFSVGTVSCISNKRMYSILCILPMSMLYNTLCIGWQLVSGGSILWFIQ